MNTTNLGEYTPNKIGKLMARRLFFTTGNSETVEMNEAQVAQMISAACELQQESVSSSRVSRTSSLFQALANLNHRRTVLYGAA